MQRRTAGAEIDVAQGISRFHSYPQPPHAVSFVSHVVPMVIPYVDVFDIDAVRSMDPQFEQPSIIATGQVDAPAAQRINCKSRLLAAEHYGSLLS